MPPAKLETLRTVRRGAELFHRSPVGPGLFFSAVPRASAAVEQ